MNSQPTLSAFTTPNHELTEGGLPDRPRHDDDDRSGCLCLFDTQTQSTLIREIAENRAPADANNHELERHKMGVASEIAVAILVRGQFDREIYDDYQGDNGRDVIAFHPKQGTVSYQVKATREIENPSRPVTRKEIAKNDYAVLCYTNSPESYVAIVGSVSCEKLRQMDDRYGCDGPVINQNIVESPIRDRIHPSDIRSHNMRRLRAPATFADTTQI